MKFQRNHIESQQQIHGHDHDFYQQSIFWEFPPGPCISLVIRNFLQKVVRKFSSFTLTLFWTLLWTFCLLIMRETASSVYICQENNLVCTLITLVLSLGTNEHYSTFFSLKVCSLDLSFHYLFIHSFAPNCSDHFISLIKLEELLKELGIIFLAVRLDVAKMFLQLINTLKNIHPYQSHVLMVKILTSFCVIYAAI